MSKQRNEQEAYTRSRGFRYKSDLQGGIRVIFEGWTDPNRGISEAFWQIVKHTYDGNNRLTDSNWAQDSKGVATDDFVHIWNNRTSLTYGPS